MVVWFGRLRLAGAKISEVGGFKKQKRMGGTQGVSPAARVSGLSI
jgi:hypothetical protein